MSRFVYRHEKRNQISFPLGGLGTGCIGLAGNGRLIDWEIFNRPNKGSVNGLSHFALKAERGGQVLDLRVLHGDMNGSYMGERGRSFFYEGYGFGPLRDSMAGMPHFSEQEFRGEFPFADLAFQDDAFPGVVSLTAFNPFIPTNERDSGIPGAFFEISITNSTDQPIDYTVIGVMGNPFKSEGMNAVSRHEELCCLHLLNRTRSVDDFEYGDLCLATDNPQCSYQEYWYRGRWSDALEVYWRDLLKPGALHNRTYPPTEEFKQTGWNDRDHGQLAAHMRLEPGETRCVRFVLTWNFPNCRNYWSPNADAGAQQAGLENRWKNYYATQWPDSVASATYALTEWERLAHETRQFKASLFSSDLPEVALEGVSANLSVLKSPTVMRLEDGTFYGWEGVGVAAGCCEGSCTHVWNYALALAFLFPRLERSMRTANYRYNVDTNGGSHFRLQLPLGLPHSVFRPSADGQLGDVLKTYRDWKISGNTEWLQSVWSSLKQTLVYAWSPDNPDRWDPEQTGVLWGRQHHTLEMELFGPNAWLTGYYLAALKAASEMADHLGEPDFSAQLLDVFERGKCWADEHLFNGEYYGQHINLQDQDWLHTFGLSDDLTSDSYWDEEHAEIKYQVGAGCELDMLIAQWQANLYGLGSVFDQEQVKQALASTYRYNFKHLLRTEYNPWRLYTLGDEAGLIICAWPADRTKPMIPLPYAQETQVGHEWATAIHMIQAGLVDEGLMCVAAIRARYDGAKRNPWNEIECGSNCARSLASYALLNAFSGFQFDGVRREIGFAPIRLVDGEFHCFWSLDSGWGSVQITESSVVLHLVYGSLCLDSFLLPPSMHISSVTGVKVKDQSVAYFRQENRMVFTQSITISVGDKLRIQWTVSHA